MLELLLSLLILAPALSLRPWRMLARRSLVAPWVATLLVLPALWSLPLRQDVSLQLQWSGACLVVLCLGWPLAVLTLAVVGVLTWVLAPAPAVAVLDLTLWHGLMPATLALGLGALLRRYAPHQPFVYVLGRAFLGTGLSLFLSNVLAHAAGHPVPTVGSELAWVAHGLMAWGDAVVTGMLTAVFVAYRPQWLATWSDRLYLNNT